MKTLVVALALILASSAIVSVSKGDIAFPKPTRSAQTGPSGAKPSPSRSPSPAASSSPSQSASEASPGLISSGLAVGAITTTSLIGIILIRRRDDYPS